MFFLSIKKKRDMSSLCADVICAAESPDGLLSHASKADLDLLYNFLRPKFTPRLRAKAYHYERHIIQNVNERFVYHACLQAYHSNFLQKSFYGVKVKYVV